MEELETEYDEYSRTLPILLKQHEGGEDAIQLFKFSLFKWTKDGVIFERLHRIGLKIFYDVGKKDFIYYFKCQKDGLNNQIMDLVLSFFKDHEPLLKQIALSDVLEVLRW
jgi:hypothetical protein